MAATGTATYNDDLSTTKDKVRFLLGDTASPYELSDGEIAWLLSEDGDRPYYAAASGARTLAAKYAGEESSRSLGDLSVSREAGSKAAEFRMLSAHLKEQAAARSGMAPRARNLGGTPIAGIMDNPRAGT
jgi:hypothetical protein